MDEEVVLERFIGEGNTWPSYQEIEDDTDYPDLDDWEFEE